MRKVKLFLVYVSVISTVLVFSKCSLNEDIAKITDSLDSLQIIIGTPEFKTSLHIEFVDAKTNERIEDQDVRITLGGTDAGYVYNNVGERNPYYTAHSGMIDLAIDPHINNMIANKPLSFSISTSATNYAPANQDVEIFEAKRNRIVVPMINLNNPPEGVTVVSNTNIGTTDNNGSLLLPTYIQFVPNGRLIKSSSENVISGIELPEGLILLDYFGKPLKGKVELRAWIENFKNANLSHNYYSSSLYQMFANYGMQLVVRTTNDTELVGSIMNGNFKITLSLPNDYLNTVTNKSVNVGDEFKRICYVRGPIIYKDNTITELKIDTVRVNNGTKYIEFSTKSFSGWWGEPISDICNNTGPIFKFVTDSNDYSTVTAIYKSKWNSLILSKNVSLHQSWNDRNFKTRYLPKGVTTHLFKPFSGTNDEIEWSFSPDSIVVPNSCDSNTFIIKAKKQVKPGIEYIDVDIDLTILSKTNKKIAIKPNLWVYYARYGWNSQSNMDAEMKNGKITLHAMIDKNQGLSIEYRLDIYIGDERYRAKMFCQKLNNKYEIKFGFDDYPTEYFYMNPTTVRNSINVVEIKYNLTLSESSFNLF